MCVCVCVCDRLVTAGLLQQIRRIDVNTARSNDLLNKQNKQKHVTTSLEQNSGLQLPASSGF